MSNLSVTERDSILVIDSRLIAQDLGIAHKNLLETLNNYSKQIETAFGVVRFETEKPLKGTKGGRPERVAYLTEDQAILLMTFSRNNERVVGCKIALVQAFSEAKRLIKEGSPAHPEDFERMKLELELIRSKQHYQDTGYATALSSSLAMLRYFRGDAPPPKEIERIEHFVDVCTGKEVGSSEGRSLTQLIADAGLNPKSAKDRNRVKELLKCCGLDYDSGQGWSTASYLRKYPVLKDEVYGQALKAVLGEFASGDSQPNLFVHQMQQAALNPRKTTQFIDGVDQ